MNTSRKTVFIEGVAIEISFADAKRNLSELIFSTVSAAVADAGKGYTGIDSVVLAAHDLVDGRSLSSMVTAPAAGAYLRDEIRFGDDGAAAFAAGVTRIEASESERTIVAAWGRASEHDVTAVSRALFDPFMSAPLGLQELDVSALRAGLWLRQGGDATQRDAALGRREAAASANPRGLKQSGGQSSPPYPLREGEGPVWADLVVALVISSQSAGVRLAGMGQSSEPFYIGDRNLAELTSLRRASERAFADAGLSPGQIDLFEVDGLSLFDEALALEAIGLAPTGTGLDRLARDGRCNPSGGGGAGYCAPAMGLARIAEACLQLQGRAGAIQVPQVRRAFASGGSIVAGQTHTAVILEAA